jgi:hypothetical protein
MTSISQPDQRVDFAILNADGTLFMSHLFMGVKTCCQTKKIWQHLTFSDALLHPPAFQDGYGGGESVESGDLQGVTLIIQKALISLALHSGITSYANTLPSEKSLCLRLPTNCEIWESNSWQMLNIDISPERTKFAPRVPKMS